MVSIAAMLDLTARARHLRELIYSAAMSPKTAEYMLESLPVSIERVEFIRVENDVEDFY